MQRSASWLPSTNVNSINDNDNNMSSFLRETQHDKNYSLEYISNQPHMLQKNDLTFEDLINIPDPYFDSPTPNLTKTIDHQHDLLKNMKKIDFYQKRCAKLDKSIKTKSVEYKVLYKKHKLLNAKYVRLHRQFQKLKMDGKKTIQDRIEQLPNTVPKPAKTFSGMILRPKGSKKAYTEDEKVIAQNICFRSNKAYNFMKDALNIHLPSKSSLNNWLPLKHLTSGFNKSLMDKLRHQFADMKDYEKQSILMFDEIVVRNDLKFHEVLDQIEGFVDLGSRREFKIGNYIQVFMIRGIFSDFKFYVSYFVSEYSMKGEELLPLLFQNLDNAEDIGAVVRVVVCDQGSGNCKAYSELGITISKPYFMYGDRKIVAMFDPPHLFKSIRNALINNNFICPEGIVSWDVVRELREKDAQSIGTRACLKLTEKHVNPGHFDKMKVRYAVQVLSNSVSDAITTMAENNLFQKSNNKKNAVSTAIFIKKINNLFDCMNSSCVSSKSLLKTAFTSNGAAHQYMIEMVAYLKQIKIVNSPPVRCISGMI